MTEDAFNKILMEKQTKILETRGDVRELMKEKQELIKTKLSAKGIKTWLKNGFGIVSVFRKIIKRKPKKK